MKARLLPLRIKRHKPIMDKAATGNLVESYRTTPRSNIVLPYPHNLAKNPIDQEINLFTSSQEEVLVVVIDVIHNVFGSSQPAKIASSRMIRPSLSPFELARLTKSCAPAGLRRQSALGSAPSGRCICGAVPSALCKQWATRPVFWSARGSTTKRPHKGGRSSDCDG
jgi:hypothetical protein